MADLSLTDGVLGVSGIPILSDVHESVFLTPAQVDSGCFIGVHSDKPGSCLVFPVGKLIGLRFLSLYRFKLWWMTQWMGKCGQEIPHETQFLMVEVPDSLTQVTYYAIFLPILEGSFRAVLQGNPKDELEICLESGDPSVQELIGKDLVYVAAGVDPYRIIETSIKFLEQHLGTFFHRDRKEVPDILNWFGWCTWDAFYTDVTADGVKAGLKSLENGGAPARFVIIDDGWQTVEMDPVSTEARIGDSANLSNRLSRITENQKFQRDYIGDEEGPGTGFRQIIHELKDQCSLKYVYIWHAIVGYWGGIKADTAEMQVYNPKMVSPVIPPGVESNGIDFVMKSIMMNKVGLVDPEKVDSFYNDLHSYLSSVGIDGVKVDNQSILETLGVGSGGRVNLARKYHEALETSVSKNFGNNGTIACMSHSMDSFYNAKKTAIIRASDDFFPRDPASHTIHVASVSYNSIFLGEFMHPDWDMFHSLHPMAEYHAAARAVGGCPVYVSDKPENHDFNVLKKLVLPDGSILRAKLPGRPTRDCLFSDPTSDGKSLLKIWNMNDCTGVLGVFNCQGAAWSRTSVRNVIHDEHPKTISGTIQAMDVAYLGKVAAKGWDGDCILYSHREGKPTYVSDKQPISIELKGREFELFTVVPVEKLSKEAAFAPIGLIKMLNSGGAIKELKYESKQVVHMRVRGCGVFGAYSSLKPRRVVVEMEEKEFVYEESSKLLSLSLGVPVEKTYLWSVTVEL